MNILSNIFKKKSDKVTLILNPKGKNCIGGKANSEFEIPKLETSAIVYFGCISKKEQHLEQIDFDLHLICPFFIDLREPVFFDYSNSKKPELIRENVPTDFQPLYDEIPNTAYVEYKKLNFIFDNPLPTKVKIGVHNIDMIPGEIGHCGKPNWIRDENWPICPITGNKMKFLFQLAEIDDCETLVGQEIIDEDFDPYLNFCHGYLYIFYEPESKVIAYLNQY
ncbi:hypothetical protein [Nonlabens sp. Asnod3-A02]|uniref:hypothetical protein n=1 Tax=Nonlabens sp. Asnod3-A02 TaxID=3160579 RepID=UPI00386787DC